MTKRTATHWVISVIIYCIGLLSLAFAVAFSANAGLGISPVNSLPYVLADSLGMMSNPGNVVTAVFCFYILLQFVILRKDFKIYNVLQIAFSTVFGYFVNFAKSIVGSWRIADGYAGSLILMLISVVMIAIGVFLYVGVDIIPMPMEGLTMAIATKVGKPFPKVKVIVDCSVVALGIALSALLLGSPFKWIREGTVLSAFCVGYLIAGLRRLFGTALTNLALGDKKQSQNS